MDHQEDDTFAKYSFNNTGYARIPQTTPNAGLYTGEKFADGAAYGPVHVKPDGFFMTTETLKSANPPPGAINQMGETLRPGNNRQLLGSDIEKLGSILCPNTKFNKAVPVAYNSHSSDCSEFP